MTTQEPLSAYLLRQKLITPENLTEAIREGAERKEPLPHTLIRMEIIKGDKIYEVLSQYYGVTFVNVKQAIDSSLFQLLPEAVIRKYKTVPIKLSGKNMTVAMVEPNNEFSKEYLQMVSGYFIETMGILEADFNKVLKLYFADSTVNKIVKDLSIPEVETLVQQASTGDEDKPVARLVDTILMHAVRLTASDIHLEPQEQEFLIRFRIDGVLRNIDILPRKLHGPVVSRIKVTAGMNIAERRIPQDGQIRMRILDRDIDLRVSTMPARYGEKAVMRILDKTNFVLGLDQLGLNITTQSKMEEIITQSSGMFLVTGPTGSGKTTTLYTCLNRIRSPLTNIITLEDPIEYELLAGKVNEGGITQVQVNSKIGFGFVEGLKASLRQDPDVIFVGEIRDCDSAEIAFTAALTGHFVMSSLHTIDAPATITRLLDMGIEPFLIVSTLKGVVAQRLVRVLCSYCKEAYNPPKRVLEKLPMGVLPKTDQVTFYRPKGCPWCNKSGYRGRKGIYELMDMSESLKEIILNKGTIREIAKAAAQGGMLSMRQTGLEAVVAGVTSVAEVLRVAPQE